MAIQVIEWFAGSKYVTFKFNFNDNDEDDDDDDNGKEDYVESTKVHRRVLFRCIALRFSNRLYSLIWYGF